MKITTILFLLATTVRAQEIHTITAYSHGCTMNRDNPHNIPQRASNGKWPIYNMTVAADPKLYPPNTEIIIEGIGIWGVYDTGSKIKGRHIDLFVKDCAFAKEWGKRKLKVWKVPKNSTKWSTYNDN